MNVPESSGQSTHAYDTGRGESVDTISAGLAGEESKSNNSRLIKDTESVSTTENENKMKQIRIDHAWAKGQLDEEMNHVNVLGLMREFSPNDEEIFTLNKKQKKPPKEEQ